MIKADWKTAIGMIALTILLVAMEALFQRYKKRKLSFDMKEAKTSTGIFLVQVVDTFVFRGFSIAMIAWAYSNRLWDLPEFSWMWFPVGLVVAEFCYYWMHRYTHHTRYGWLNHRSHHTARHFNTSVAYRVGPGSFITFQWAFVVALAFLGVHPVYIGLYVLLNKGYAFITHTEINLKFGPLAWIFVTPSHHRVHHGRNKEYIDKNFGNILIIFDHIFGTYKKEDPKIQIEYGVTEDVDPNSLWENVGKVWTDFAVDVYKAPGVANKVRLFYKPPGWKPVAAVEVTAEEKRRIS